MRMGSRLSSTLVHEGFLKTEALKEILALQVIKGGQLDTLLLEKGIISEAKLLALLSQTTGYSPLTPQMMEMVTEDVAEIIDLPTADKNGICPVSFDEESITILVGETVDHITLEELAFELGRRLSPIVSPSIRILQAKQKAFHTPLAPRYLALLEKLGDVPAIEGFDRQSKPHIVSTIEPKKTKSYPIIAKPDATDDNRADQPDTTAEETKQEQEQEQEQEQVTNSATSSLKPLIQDSISPALLPEPLDNDSSPTATPDSDDIEPPAFSAAIQPPLDGQLQTDEHVFGEDQPSTADVPTAAPPSGEEEIVYLDAQPSNEALSLEALDAYESPLTGELTSPEEQSDTLETPVVDQEPDAPELDVPPADENLQPIALSTQPATPQTVLASPLAETATAESPTSPRVEIRLGVGHFADDQSDEPTLVNVPADFYQRLEQEELSVQSHEPTAPPLDTTAAVSLPSLDEETLLAIKQAISRDELLIALLRATNQYLECVQIYVVKGKKLQGHLEMNAGQLDIVTIRTRSISLEASTVASRVVQDGGIFIGPAPTTDLSGTTLLSAGILSLNGLCLVPIILLGKTVCLLLGHSYDQPLDPKLRPLLTRLAHEAAVGLAALIKRQKESSSLAKVESPPPEALISPHEDQPPSLAARTQSGVIESPPAEASFDATMFPVEAGPLVALPKAEAPLSVNDTRAVSSQRVIPPEGFAFDSVQPIDSSPRLDEHLVEQPTPSSAATAGAQQELSPTIHDIPYLIAELEHDEISARNAEQQLKLLGSAAIQALISRFPGRLRFNRLAPHSQLPPVGECSAVLHALTSMGRPVLLAIPPLLQHKDLDIRFYTTYLMSELIYPEAVALLAISLLDTSPDIRIIAAQILRRFRELEQFPSLLQDLMADLNHPDPRPRRAAIDALGALNEREAIPSLIQLLADPEPEVAESSCNALVTLTKQDFARNEKKWWTWWEKNQQRHRIEWLLDGLLHKAPELRASSATELEELTGLSFGYHFEMDRHQREDIHQRFLQWWIESGAQRFIDLK